MITQTILSDRVISQKIGTSAELNDAYKTIENLKEDIVELNNEIDQLEDTIEDKDEQLANIDAVHQAEIDSINQAHSNQISQMELEHTNTVNQLVNDYEDQIEGIEQGYIDRDNELMVIINDINNLL